MCRGLFIRHPSWVAKHCTFTFSGSDYCTVPGIPLQVPRGSSISVLHLTGEGGGGGSSAYFHALLLYVGRSSSPLYHVRISEYPGVCGVSPSPAARSLVEESVTSPTEVSKLTGHLMGTPPWARGGRG